MFATSKFGVSVPFADAPPLTDSQRELLDKLIPEKRVLDLTAQHQEYLRTYLDSGSLPTHHAGTLVAALVHARTIPDSLPDTYEDRVLEYLRVKTAYDLGQTTLDEEVHAYRKMKAFVRGDRVVITDMGLEAVVIAVDDRRSRVLVSDGIVETWLDASLIEHE